jgi:hypothetical protein
LLLYVNVTYSFSDFPGELMYFDKSMLPYPTKSSVIVS